MFAMPAPRQPQLVIDNDTGVDVSHMYQPDVQTDGDAAWHEEQDGGATVYLGGASEGGLGAAIEDVKNAPFDANLAEFLDESTLGRIAEGLLEGIEADLESRKDWEALLNKGTELLGFKIEDRDFPFKGAAGVHHPVMTEAIIRFQATARGEMLPADGPVRTKIIGDDDPDAEAKAERVKNYFNYFLTEVDKGYYAEFDKMLVHLGVGGNAFKKVFRDPLKRRPASPFILPDQFIVNYAATSLENAARKTHVIPTSKTELIKKQLVGVYRKVDLGEAAEEETEVQSVRNSVDGRSMELAEGDDRYMVYECHTDVDIDVPGLEHVGKDGEPTGLPLPYIIAVEKESRKILAIYRNWQENDPDYATGPQAEEHFVHYSLIPGLGFYAFGFAHLLGGIAKGSTMLLRQLIDAGTLSNFPGGLRVKGMKVDDSSMTVAPCEFKEIDTGGLPIQDAVMALPYKDPSEVLVQLMGALVDAAQRLGATADMQVGEGRQDAPVGTTVALIEQAMKIMSAIHKRLHVSHRDELRLLAKLFGREQGARYPYRIDGQVGMAVAADFSGGAVDILPVSDPNLPTQAQRLALSDAKLKLAQQAPQIHDLRAAYEDMYITLGLTKQQIQRIMPPPQQAQPADPVTEFQNVLAGKPLAAGLMQLHDAHITAHMAQAQTPGLDKLPAYSALIAHIAEHVGMKYRVLVMQAAQQRGVQLPPPGQPLPPQLENAITLLTAQHSQEILAQFRQHMDPETALAQEANDLKRQEIQMKREDGQRKSAENRIQNQTELVKTTAQLANDAAERRSKVVQGAQRIEAERIKAKGNVAAALLQTAVDMRGQSHDTLRSALDHHATMTGHGIAAHQIHADRASLALEHKRLPIEHKQADAAILSAKADGIAARKPAPRPTAR